MRKLLPTITLTAALALTTLCEAGSRPRKTAAPTTYLTVGEQLCQTMGAIAYNTVEARDAGMSYLTLLDEARRVLALAPPTDDLQRSIALSMLDNLHMVYDTPSVTPAGNRRVTERMCLQALEQYVQAHKAKTAKDRY